MWRRVSPGSGSGAASAVPPSREPAGVRARLLRVPEARRRAGRAERHVRARRARVHHPGQRGGRDPDPGRRSPPSSRTLGETPSVRARIGGSEPGSVPFDALAAPTPRCGAVERDRDEIAAILYTSATTGRPKGVMLSHANVVSNTDATVHHLGMTPEDRGLCALPLFHCFGQNFILNALVTPAAPLVLQRALRAGRRSSPRSPRPHHHAFGVPTMYILLLTAGLGRDTSSLRALLLGGGHAARDSSRAGRGAPATGSSRATGSPRLALRHLQPRAAHRLGSVGKRSRASR